MISSLTLSFVRAVLSWYFIGMLVFFLGKPEWAQNVYAVLRNYPFVPVFPVAGLSTALQVQLTLISYWTLPLLVAVVLQLGLAYFFARQRVSSKLDSQEQALAPRGEFYSVMVPGFSVGELPLPVVPRQKFNKKIQFTNHSTDEIIGPFGGGAVFIQLPVLEEMAGALGYCNNIELALCAELVELLHSYEGHYAGAGHGVDLLDHTFNVAEEAVKRCTPDFRLPLIAAFAHDIGKLITFKKDDKGEWIRKGYHSREGARILASLPSFAKLPLVEQRALVLVLKYEHTFAAIPALGGDSQASALASRVLVSLTQADKVATAAEKDRNLEQMQPEDLLWQDFVDNIRNVPVLQMGKTKVKNQINHPRNHPYIYLYEVPWREGAVARMPQEVAAALDLNRRDQGRIAKYTRIFTEKLRKEGVLVESHEGMTTPPGNPLWNIRSGMMGKDLDLGQAINGVIALHAAALWEKLNFRLSEFSDFNVRVESPNSDGAGNVYSTPQDARSVPQLADNISLGLSPAQFNKDHPMQEKAGKDSSVLDRMDQKVAEQIGLVSSDTLTATQKTRTMRRSFQTQDTSAATKALIDITKAPERKFAAQAPAPAAPKAVPAPVPPKSTPLSSATDAKPAASPVSAPKAAAAATPATPPAAATPSATFAGDAPVGSSAASNNVVAPAGEKDLLCAVPDKQEEALSAKTPTAIEAAVPAPTPQTDSDAPAADTTLLANDALLSLSDEAEDPMADISEDSSELLANQLQEPFSQSQKVEDSDADDDTDEGNAAYAKEDVSVAEENALPEQNDNPLSLQDIGLDEHTAAVVTNEQTTSEKSKLSFKARDLTVSEERNGIAIADRAVCVAFPHLKVGDKYYTTRSPLVHSKGTLAGTLYNQKAIASPAPQNKKPSEPPSAKPAFTPKPAEPQKKATPGNSGQASPGKPVPVADKLSFLAQKSSAPRPARRF